MAPAWYGGFLPTWWAWDYISSTGMKTLPLLVKQHPAVSKTFLLLLPLHHSFSLRISSSEMMNEAFPVQSQFLVAVCVVPGEKIGIVQRACSIKTTYKWQASTLNSRLWPFWQAIFVQLECTWEHLWALLTRKRQHKVPCRIAKLSCSDWGASWPLILWPIGKHYFVRRADVR